LGDFNSKLLHAFGLAKMGVFDFCDKITKINNACAKTKTPITSTIVMCRVLLSLVGLVLESFVKFNMVFPAVDKWSCDGDDSRKAMIFKKECELI